MLKISRNNPSLIKYMGSKSEIIDSIINSLNDIHKPGQAICDLFSGSCTLASALRNNNVPIYTNDIQAYSKVLAQTYLGNYQWSAYPKIDDIIREVEQLVAIWKDEHPIFWEKFDYSQNFNLEKFNLIEQEQRQLLHNNNFINSLRNSPYKNIQTHHLFTLCYSGTYWGFQQCIWIDCLRCVIDRYKENSEFYNLLLACTMFAMAYNSQSTGHYAQFRKAQTLTSMNDILIYRKKTLCSFLKRKYEELQSVLLKAPPSYITQLDYLDCINTLPKNTLVYADPPYCFVHYSRFYHILETFVLYDYPSVQYTGRYRSDRHQSPFCISTKVESAFCTMFELLATRDCELVLSYSNSSTTMIKLSQLLLNAFCIFNGVAQQSCQTYYEQLEAKVNHLVLQNTTTCNSLNVSAFLQDILHIQPKYQITLKLFPHIHSRMGRTKKKDISVFEALILVSKI